MRFSKANLRPRPVMRIDRLALKDQKVVYLLVANKPIRYCFRRRRGGDLRVDKNKIVYIGTTKTGSSRISGSLSYRAEEALSDYGIRHLDAYIVKCRGKGNVKMWVELESALLDIFMHTYGELPRCNHKKGRESKYFNKDRLLKIIKRFEK